jgi:hypothetical protein
VSRRLAVWGPVLALAGGLATVAAPVGALDGRQVLTGPFPLVGTTFDCRFRARSDLVVSPIARSFVARPRQSLFTVSAIQGVVMPVATLDQRLADASALIQQSQGPGDANCCYATRRTGGIGVFAPPAGMVGGVITTQAEQNAVFGVNAGIKVVAGISFCGQAGNYAGCADGSTLIVTAGTGAATYAHEVGHLAGLCHVGTNCTPTCGQAGDCAGCADPSSTNIMYFRTCPNRGVITTAQCSAYTGFGTP